MACRLKKKREWTHRIMLEASLHTQNSFITLTYNDEHLPFYVEDKELGVTHSSNHPMLNPDHLRLFWMRLRKDQDTYGRRLRYYAVGEYGDDTFRPHYHAVVFGLPPCIYGTTQAWRVRERGYCCDPCNAIQRQWPYGNVFVGQVERASAAYVCGYVTKKLTDTDDARLGGRYPEFCRMSKRPGLGARYIPEIASRLLELPKTVLDQMPDVPNALRHGGKPWPLGRYLIRLLRQQIGRSPDAPQVAIESKKEEVRLLQEIAKPVQGGLSFSQVYKSLCLEINAPQFNKMVNKQQYSKKRSKL